MLAGYQQFSSSRWRIAVPFSFPTVPSRKGRAELFHGAHGGVCVDRKEDQPRFVEITEFRTERLPKKSPIFGWSDVGGCMGNDVREHTSSDYPQAP
eukprot:524716-Pyramimonas_sp.AAC.1